MINCLINGLSGLFFKIQDLSSSSTAFPDKALPQDHELCISPYDFRISSLSGYDLHRECGFTEDDFTTKNLQTKLINFCL